MPKEEIPEMFPQELVRNAEAATEAAKQAAGGTAPSPAQPGAAVPAAPTAPAVVQPQAQAKPKVSVETDERGVLAAQNLDAQWRLASALAMPGVLGPAYENKPGAVLMAMNLAAEKGKGPFSFLHSSYEVKGKITEWGADALGAVYASGKAKRLEFFFISEEGKRIAEDDFKTKPWAAVALGERADGITKVIRCFSLDDARQANLLGNPKKETWAQYTRRMMETKAIGWMLKVAFPDVIAGLEMPEYDEHAPSDKGTTSAPAGSTTASRLKDANRSQAQAGGEVQALPDMRAEAGGSGQPSGSVPHPHVRGDQEGPAREPDSTLQAAPQPAARKRTGARRVVQPAQGASEARA